MRDISCVTLAGTTHASIENSPDSWMMSKSFADEVVEACALPSVIVMPQPPNQVTPPEKLRSIAGSTPLVS